MRAYEVAALLLYVGLLVGGAVVAGAFGFVMKDADNYCPLTVRGNVGTSDHSLCDFSLFSAVAGALYGLVMTLYGVFKCYKSTDK